MNRMLIPFLLSVLMAGALFAQQLSTTPVSRMNQKWWSSRFEENKKQAQKGNVDVIFLGDSITDFWRNRGRVQYDKYFGEFKTVNMGYSADRTEHVLWRLDNGEMDGANAKVIVLMIGTNNTGHRFQKEKMQDTVDGVHAILDRLAKISPKSKVALLPIFPRSAKKDDPMRIRNDAVNTEIKKFADNKRVFWIDFNKKLLQPDGTLSRDIMPDLLHPNAKGYTIWAESILPFIQKTVYGLPVEPQPRTWDWWKERFEENKKRSAKGDCDIVFLGDSITDFWRNRGKRQFDHYFGAYKTINMGYGGDCTENVLWRLDHGEMDGANPKLIMLMIGTNNTGARFKQETPQQTVTGIRLILNRLAKIAPNAKILLLPIFPRGATETDPLRMRNEMINAQIKKFADNKRVFWIDFNKKLLQPDGTLSRDIMPDLLHPNEKGYTIWAESILPFIQKTVRPAVVPEPRNWGWWKNRFEENKKLAAEGNYDVIFLGDSITDSWRNRGKAQYDKYFGEFKTINMGYSADRTEHVLWRLDNGEMNGANAKLVVLMIGTNNPGQRGRAERVPDTIAGVRAILDRLAKIAPDTKVLLLPIFPRAASKTNWIRVFNDKVNAEIQKFADNKRVFWLDFNQKFLKPDGTLTKDIMPDLLHPSPKGYTIWAESILPFVRQTVRASVTPVPQQADWWKKRFDEKCKLAKSKKWDFVFVGDSIVHAWELRGLTEWNTLVVPYNAFCSGYSGDRTENVLWRLDHGELDGMNPKAIFLLIGTNNTGLRSLVQERPEDTARGIRAILDRLTKIAPNAKIILHPIFPRGALHTDPLRVRNEKVNDLVRPYADGKRIFWVDFNQKFLCADGVLTNDFMVNDLLHPGPKGYRLWFQEIKPYLDRFSK